MVGVYRPPGLRVGVAGAGDGGEANLGATAGATAARFVPSELLPDSGIYVRGSLPKQALSHYRAAGVLPYVVRPLCNEQGRLVPSVTVLLGKQMTKSNDRRWRQRWVEFGGKIEDEDEGVPERTALREFREETGGQFSVQPDLHEAVIWNRACKYLLYLGRVNEVPADLNTNDEIKEFRFVDLQTFLKAVGEGHFCGCEISFRTRSCIQHPKAGRLLRSLLAEASSADLA